MLDLCLCTTILENNVPKHEYNRIKNLQDHNFNERRKLSLKKQNKEQSKGR